MQAGEHRPSRLIRPPGFVGLRFGLVRFQVLRAAPGTPRPEPGDRDAKRRQKLTGIIKGHLERFGYPRPWAKDETDAERTARLADLATLAGVSEIGTSGDLDTDELSAVADTLARMRDRPALDGMLAAVRDAMQDVEDSRDE